MGFDKRWLCCLVLPVGHVKVNPETRLVFQHRYRVGQRAADTYCDATARDEHQRHSDRRGESGGA